MVSIYTLTAIAVRFRVTTVKQYSHYMSLAASKRTGREQCADITSCSRTVILP